MSAEVIAIGLSKEQKEIIKRAAKGIAAAQKAFIAEHDARLTEVMAAMGYEHPQAAAEVYTDAFDQLDTGGLVNIFDDAKAWEAALLKVATDDLLEDAEKEIKARLFKLREKKA